MAFDPVQEDCLRLILGDLRRKRVFPLDNPAVVERGMATYREDPARLIKTDRDRSFHLMVQAAEVIDYRVPFIADDEQASAQEDVAIDYLHEAIDLDEGNWDARRMLAALDAPCNDDYVGFLLDSADRVREDLDRVLADVSDAYDREFANDLARRPYLRWLGSIASSALIAGQYRLSLDYARRALRFSPYDPGDVRRTAMLSLAKLECPAQELDAFRRDHALAFSDVAQALRRGGRLAAKQWLDPWEALARVSAAYRTFDFAQANRLLRQLVRQYDHGAEALFYQAEFPEGVFSRVNTLSESEDELILAISEATPLLKEGYGAPDTASFSAWVSESDAVQGALEDARGRVASTATRRPGGTD